MHAFHLAIASYLALTPAWFLTVALGFSNVLAGIGYWVVLVCGMLAFAVPTCDTIVYFWSLTYIMRSMLFIDIVMCVANIWICLMDAPDVSIVNVLSGVACVLHAVGTAIASCTSTHTSFFKHPIQPTTVPWETHSVFTRLVIGGTRSVLVACAGLVCASTALQFGLTDTDYNWTVESVEQLGQIWAFPTASLVLSSLVFAGLALLLPWHVTLLHRYKRRKSSVNKDDPTYYSTTWIGGYAPVVMLVGTLFLTMCVLTLLLIQTANSLLVITWVTLISCAATVGSLIVLTVWCFLAPRPLTQLESF